MREYVEFTKDELLRANTVSLEDYLSRIGERLERAGREYRWIYEDGSGRHDSITVKGNEWYDHKNEMGGKTIDFLRQNLGFTFQDAVRELLGGGTLQSYQTISTEIKKEAKNPVEFRLPKANSNMHRVFAYLIQQRKIDANVISNFAHRRLIYESNELLGTPPKEIHNAIFVGVDHNDIPRHAHKRSICSFENTAYRGNVDGSDPGCCFWHKGSSEKLFVFEAPLDLLSYLSLHPKEWEAHSYVALCGVAEHAMLTRLHDNSYLRSVVLCLDNDVGGINAADRLTDILKEHGYSDVSLELSRNKDWNEDLIEKGGGVPKPAVPHLYRDMFHETATSLEYLPCSDLAKTRERIWAFYKDFITNHDVKSALQIASHSASAIGITLFRMGAANSPENGFVSFREKYLSTYRAYKDRAKLPGRTDAFKKATMEVMNDLKSVQIRTPEQYADTVNRLACQFDASMKLYTAIRFENEPEMMSSEKMTFSLSP